MTNVCIVGVGLMGGSLGMALRRVQDRGKRRYFVIGVGRSKDRLSKAQIVGAVDRFELDWKSAMSHADIVVLCGPVQSTAATVKKIRLNLKPGSVLTDVGSVKKSIVSDIKKVLSKTKTSFFVGAHPLAGSEKKGIQHARRDLFIGATCVLTPDGSPKEAIKSVKKMWLDVGSRCVVMTPDQHDKGLALTSHFPHLVSYALFSLVLEAAKKEPRLKSLTAGSFRDMTRVAASDATLWSGIFDLNRQTLKNLVPQFSKVMNDLSKLSGEKLKNRIHKLALGKQSW